VTSLDLLLSRVEGRPEPLCREALEEIARDHLYEVVTRMIAADAEPEHSCTECWDKDEENERLEKQVETLEADARRLNNDLDDARAEAAERLTIINAVRAALVG